MAKDRYTQLEGLDRKEDMSPKGPTCRIVWRDMAYCTVLSVIREMGPEVAYDSNLGRPERRSYRIA